MRCNLQRDIPPIALMSKATVMGAALTLSDSSSAASTPVQKNCLRCGEEYIVLVNDYSFHFFVTCDSIDWLKFALLINHKT